MVREKCKIMDISFAFLKHRSPLHAATLPLVINLTFTSPTDFGELTHTPD